MEKHKPQRLSAINRTILTILGTVLVILVLLITLSVNTVFTSRLAAAKERDGDQAEQIARWVRHSFNNVVNLLSLTAHSLSELNYHSGEKDAAVPVDNAVDSILLAMMNFDSSVYDAWVIFEKGAYYHDSYHTKEYVRYGGGVTEVLLPDEEISLEDEVLEPWYNIPLTTGGVYFDYVGLYDYGEEFGEMYTATISLPVVSNGKIIGVCGVDITYQDIFQPIEYLHGEEERLILLLGRDMTILHASDPDVDIVDKNFGDFFPLTDIGLAQGASDREKMFTNEIVSPFSGKKSLISLQLINVDIMGKDHLLYIYMETPLQALYAPGYGIITMMVIGGLVCMALIILTIFHNINTLVKPIRKLTTYAQQIAAGNYLSTNFIEIAFNDSMNDKNEIAVLQSAFMKMVSTLNENLNKEERQVEERTRELVLMTRDAEEARKRAEKADEVKSRFLANMSHQIRTPMNAIIGMSELLLASNLSTSQNERVEAIHASSISLLDVINSILDLSKIQTNQLFLEPAHYDFRALIDSIDSTMQSLTRANDLTFKLEIQDELPKCLYGDDVRLRQVLLNILGNAVKFTDKGFVHFTVGITEESIRFSVNDTGIGIRAEDIPLVFEAFMQTDMQKNHRKEGAGLSLAISNLLVEMMGGKINVESMYGHGATFLVTIPKVPGDETLIVQDDTGDNEIYAPDTNILVVDDNTIDLNVASGLLRLCGISADTAPSGREAIKMASEKPYDIIFMDHMMPGIDGIEACKKIREAGLNVPVIALTANAIEGSRELYQASGMNDFLTKPVDKTLLFKLLKKWISPEKIKSVPPGITKLAAADQAKTETQTDFWKIIEKIKGLSIETGLERIYGQKDVYKKTLKLTIKEIAKCDENLKEFLAAGDMKNFRIEVHGIKGSLANVGVMELSARAYELEKASANEDAAFCAANMPHFLETLRVLGSDLSEAFEKDSQNRGPIEIPAELPPILEKLAAALDQSDFSAIDEAVESLNALTADDALKEEIDKIKEAVMMMDNEGVMKIINGLLN